jgi:branched-chain amino acid transport system substrate-binding protein
MKKKDVKRMEMAVVFILLVTVCLIGAAQAGEPIKIGFVGGLTGQNSDLGIGGRDGVLLAVKEKNEKGGLLGSPVELLIRDDGHDPKRALEVDEDLIGRGVAAIIGHMTSTMSLAAKPLVNQRKVLMISPTAASTALSGEPGYFFRVYEPLDRAARALASHMRTSMGIRTVGVIYDQTNPTYSEDCYRNFKEAFKKAGGEILAVRPLPLKDRGDFIRLVRKLKALGPQGLYLIASASDTALICQQVRKLSWKVPLLASEWSFTQELLSLGGGTVEGLIGIRAFNPESRNSAYLSFRKRFQDQFGREPGFPSACGYEAAQVLFRALEAAGGLKEKLPETIVRIKDFEGLQGPIRIDRSGDAHRTKFITSIQNRKFQVLTELDAPNSLAKQEKRTTR